MKSAFTAIEGRRHAIGDRMQGMGISRRGVLRGALGSAGLLAGGANLLLAACEGERRPPPGPPPLSLKHRGINYDVGTDSDFDGASPAWDAASMRRDVRAIRDDLHCNAIGIHGTDITRLIETAAHALETGLQVWLQPRRFDVPPEALLAHVARVADEAERLRRQYSNVVLNVGVEITLLNTGFVPGATVLDRIVSFESLSEAHWQQMMLRLEEVLGQVRSLARDRFGGPLTYGAGPWEWDGIDWSGFDIVGLDHYEDATNRSEYVEPLRRFRDQGKPVVVLEFGCCTYEGADDAGGMGWNILDRDHPGFLDRPRVRSEQTQADYLDHLLDVFQAEQVDGAFVYQFATPELLHSPEAIRDLDMASYSVVKAVSRNEATGAYHWEPKRAFHSLARRYAL